jgi:phage tail-like protein
MDTAAAMPKSGYEIYEVKDKEGKELGRAGAPELKNANVEARRIFTVADRSSSIDDPATRPDIPSMGVVKKNTLKGVNGFIIEEFVQTHRFYVADVTGDEQSVFEWEENSTPKTLAAGFSGCTAPRFEIASKEIKEGTWEFPRVFCKGANAQSITLSKGLVRAETGFYLWLLNAMRGKLTRRTIEIVSYGRGGSLQSSKRLWLQPNQLRDVSVCVWTLYNCYPLGYRTGQDWDADSGKIQIAELDMHYEWFEESAGKMYAGVAIENA